MYSESTIIPSVAKAESQSEISNIAYGVTVQIIATAIVSEVMESFVLATKNNREEIISINPARTTETENPVIAI